MRGSIEKRGDKYSIRVDAGRDHTGKRRQIRRSGFRTKKEAEQKINEILFEINQGKQMFSEGITIQQLYEKYDTVHLSHLKENTRNNYRFGYKCLLKYLKEDTLEYIKPFHLQEAYHNLLTDYSVHTHNTAVTVMSALFEFAMDNDLLKKNPHNKIKMKKLPKKDIEIWDSEEIEAFSEASKENMIHHTLYMLTLHTGMRKGEIRGLSWNDINLKDKVVRVRRSLHHSRSNFKEATEPKSESSIRDVYISDYVAELLKEFKKHHWIANIDNAVFATEKGTIIPGSTIDYNLKKYAKEAHVRPIRFHDLRHTHASILIKSGVNIKVVSERLGHSDVATTLNIYTHFDETSKREAAELFSTVTAR